MTRFAFLIGLPLTILLTLSVGGLTTGCDEKNKKKKTTPKERVRPRAQGSVQVSSKGAKLLKCKQTEGTRIVTLDLNRDKKRDRWLLIADKDGRKVCHEMDTDYDGKRDLSITYYDDGVTKRRIWWDVDYDGYWDQVMYNRPDGTKERVEIRPYAPQPEERKAGEWNPTVWKYYRVVKGKGTVIDRIEMDKDRNGYKDYWERYENGKLAEVSWADPGDTDEKPKHWIESPDEGQDKGFRGKDEPGKAKAKAEKGEGKGEGGEGGAGGKGSGTK